MTSDAVSTPAALRRVWRIVQRTEGACLIFLWSDQYQQLQSLRHRLDGQLRLRSQRLCMCELWADAETASQQADACLQSILQPKPGDEHNPLWLHMGTSSDNPHAVAQQVLARLNERRSQTLQWPRALIVSGPLGGDAWAARVAPDLWSVRALSLELALAAVDVATDWLHDAVATPLPGVMGKSVSSAPRPTGYQSLLRAWQQAWQAYQAARANHEDKGLNVDLGFICIEYAFQYRELRQAEHILHQIELYLGNLMAEDFNVILPAKARQVSLWRSFKGDLQTQQGQWGLALANYEKSLEIAQKLVLTDESPQSLKDVSDSLIKVGDVQQAQGQWSLALANYEKSLEIAQKLVLLTDKSPEALRDVSVALERVGNAQETQGQWGLALANYEKSLEIAQKLVVLTDESPKALRDMLIFLSKVGDAQGAQGQWGLALANYEKGLEIAQKLVRLTDESRQALRDVSVSLISVGDAQGAQGQWGLALANYEKSLEIAQKLVVLTEESPQALRDVSVALERVGNAQETQGQSGLALANYIKSLEIRQKLVVLTDESPEALRAWIFSVVRVMVGMDCELEKPLPDLPVDWIRQVQAQARQRHGEETLADALGQLLAQMAVQDGDPPES